MAGSTDEASGTGPRATAIPGTGRGALVAATVAALVLGGVIGLAAGWKIEQSRVKSDIKGIRPVGTVTSINDRALTIRLKTATGSRTYAITKDTSVVAVGDKSTADVVKGSLVLVDGVSATGGGERARQIVLLPKSTKFGS